MLRCPGSYARFLAPFAKKKEEKEKARSFGSLPDCPRGDVQRSGVQSSVAPLVRPFRIAPVQAETAHAMSSFPKPSLVGLNRRSQSLSSTAVRFEICSARNIASSSGSGDLFPACYFIRAFSLAFRARGCPAETVRRTCSNAESIGVASSLSTAALRAYQHPQNAETSTPLPPPKAFHR